MANQRQRPQGGRPGGGRGKGAPRKKGGKVTLKKTEVILDEKCTLAVARRLHLAPESVISFLAEQGFDDLTLETVLDDEYIEIVEEHKDEMEHRDPNEIHMKPPFIVKDVAEAIGEKANVVVSELMKMRVFASITQSIAADKCEALLKSRGLKLVVDKREKKEEAKPVIKLSDPEQPEDKEADRVSRPPIVAVMGHVDHGKTSLLDALRNTNVVAGEAGAITQHTGASMVERNGMKVTFLDTPGHSAFSAMRQRGADVTDICILIVAADDGVNAQTKEALKIIMESERPLIIAINKMDLPTANPDRVLTELQNLGILTEEWGGDYGVVKISAKTGDGLDELIERIHLEAEVHELQGNPKLPGSFVVIESELEQGMGATANVVVKNGTLKAGDVVLCGEFYGKVKALVDTNGKRLKKVGPSDAVKLLGLNGPPEVGAKGLTCKNEREAKSFADERVHALRQQKLVKPRVTSLEDLLSQVSEEEKKVYKVLIKSDTRGTGEAIESELRMIESEKINLEVITNAVGSITNADVQQAAAAGAEIIGFHSRVNPGINKVAKQAKVEIKLYSLIYELIDEAREAMTGLLDKTHKEQAVGKAEILQVFVAHQGKICGSVVRDGKVKLGAHCRVHRGEDLIYTGTIKSLRRFRDNVKEVANGVECGILLDNFNDFEVGDQIEVFDYVEVADTL
ncbi:translation initiation factor IF-2 [Lentisphaera marina]|uniref:translation initiation factor IF-2 n=1 Tax=Lentisphaera marina TaxID=1111041 RepID=UPI00236592A8|nr:translation initiation factor IF-2 [Lentisphaera marina]MDD7985576.1 translation initiation factor IF-2 [Lentisphaera marina]